MTDNEKLIFELIQANPFISQQSLSEKVGLSRSAVANIISSLIRKNYLLGKAYVVKRLGTIVCIGAANVDKKIKTNGQLKQYTSNPVTSTTSIGGVSRNVAENLGRLGNQVSLISVSGNDSEWAYIKELSSPFMDVTSVVMIEGQSTGTYTALLDEEGEMYLGLADMSIYDCLTPEVLSKQSTLLQHAKCIVVDLNCPKETIEYLCSFAQRHHTKLVVITVSEPKMERLPKQLSAVDCLIVNKGESAAYFNMTLDTKEQIELAMDKWLELGVKRVVLTAGGHDIIVASPQKKWYKVKPLDNQFIVDVTGAGDAFSAAYIDAWYHGMDDEECVLAGMTNAYHTIQSEYTVRQNVTKTQLKKEMKEYRNNE
ncbi:MULTISPECIES: carbohydrate kinase [unclassified Granulicatella]|uniref:carbohydrate kinase n=1 Tax=unclassified Granulicatella TaxID=2630493 RepID=UPI001073790D|nr:MULTISPECIES: carbohydrate kinase [unclassified Granulicatella]MBF0779591.1 winged helix-turn-helix transcriptional regulator [Granulicatella sp. 19428wC4_WM01]TFU96392.1 winged helix-turn-helix transcriptional regulator [Granulicatella sp. WM01]